MKYRYTSGDARGKIHKGVLEAASEGEARRVLVEQGQEVIMITLIQEWFSWLKYRKTKEQLLVFTKLFSTLLQSGMDILRVLETTLTYSDSESMRYVIKNLYHHVSSGETLANSMRRNSRFFSEYYTAMVEAGERTGNLSLTFDALYTHMSSREKLVKKVQMAMIYPLFLLLFSIGVIFFMTFFVMPTFSGIYASFNKKLPLITQIVLSLSNGVRDYIVIIVALFIGVFLYFRRSKRREYFSTWIEKKMLKIKSLNHFIYLYESIAIFRTLQLSISSGLSLLSALEIAHKNIMNRVIRQRFLIVIESVTQGKTLSEGFQKADFLILSVQMLYIGESSNQLERMLATVCELYEEEIERRLSVLMALIEPVMILGVGALIGTLVIAMILPILTLSTVVN